MSIELIYALEQIEREKGIKKEILLEAIEAALISAYRKHFGPLQNAKVTIDWSNGDVKVFALKKVATAPVDYSSDICLDDARKINPEAEEGDIVEQEVTPRDFGRIAAQTAKQVVVQRIREAERDAIFDEFSEKIGEIVTGSIQRMEGRNSIIDLGKIEAILPQSEQTPGEEHSYGKRLKVYITEVRRTSRGPQVMVSRTHPGLVKKLFEREVPEIKQGIVEIRDVSREPGSRAKIAVYSKNNEIDPVGACVGQKGVRVQAVVEELYGEKIDIIKWSSNFVEYISSSLSPAKVIRVDINEEEKNAKVTVPDFQLSLAIGKEGQNARLAAKLTGWKIDIKSESQLRAAIEQQLLNFDGSDTIVISEDNQEDDVGDLE